MIARLAVFVILVVSATALQSILPFSKRSFAGTRQISSLFAYDERELLLVEQFKAKATMKMRGETLDENLELLSPPDMTIEEFEENVAGFMKLPFSMQLAMIRLAGLPDDSLLDVTTYAVVIDRISKQGRSLTPRKLKESLQKVQEKGRATPSKIVSSNEGDISTDEIFSIILEGASQGKNIEEFSFESCMKGNYSPNTRKENKYASAEDLEILTTTLSDDKSIFLMTSKPIPISGGYIIQGNAVKKSGKELIEALDAKLPTQWTAQVSYVPFSIRKDEGSPDFQTVLLLLNNDFSPEANKWFLALSNLATFATTLLFGIDVYAGNDAVTAHLKELIATSGEASSFVWFNRMLGQVLIPIVVIQVLHELGHLLVAWKEKIETSPPTFVPFWNLPVMGAKTQLKTSPRNLSVLFDFAFLGPFMGIMTSLIFLVIGVRMTLIADSADSMYFPTLPVDLLRCSTLGGTIVDTMFGGSGYITSQAGNTNVLLHPLAVAGFTGLLINALALLPLGSTDGARMSIAVFGRDSTFALSALTWFALLVSTLALDQHDILISAWVVYSVTQNDREIPCREEVDNVSTWRAAAAIGLWFIAVLSLVPFDHSLV